MSERRRGREMPPKKKKELPTPAAASALSKDEGEKKPKENPLIERKPRQFGIGGALPPKKDVTRFVKWPQYIRLQRQRRILYKRLKVPPPINQFTRALEKNQAATLFKLLLKYRPEDKAQKQERLRAVAEAAAQNQTPETKKPVVVKYGLNHIAYLVEQQKAQLVVIAHDVDPIELVIWLPALCKKQGVPYCIVKGKSRLGAVVHKKTATALAITAVKPEDKSTLNKLVESFTAQYNEGSRVPWGGGIMGAKSQHKTKMREKMVARELAQRAATA